jgi:enamine deaminase RidA (YjgF/YER057c/UK114 family)
VSASAEQRLQSLGIRLPAAPKPLGAYVEAVSVGNLLFLSGALPMEGGAPQFTGRIGEALTIDAGRAAARLAALNALALAREHLGSLDRIRRLVKLTVWLAAAPEFRDHANVADGASSLLADILGAERMSTRMVAGVLTLPAGVSVVVELILERKDASPASHGAVRTM